MARWMNLLRNSRFVKIGRLYIDCEKNWNARPSATGSYGRQADEIILLLEIFKEETLGLFEQRYSVLSSITSTVVGFCVLIFIMLFIHKSIFLEAIHFLVNPYY